MFQVTKNFSRNFSAPCHEKEERFFTMNNSEEFYRRIFFNRFIMNSIFILVNQPLQNNVQKFKKLKNIQMLREGHLFDNLIPSSDTAV